MATRSLTRNLLKNESDNNKHLMTGPKGNSEWVLFPGDRSLHDRRFMSFVGERGVHFALVSRSARNIVFAPLRS